MPFSWERRILWYHSHNYFTIWLFCSIWIIMRLEQFDSVNWKSGGLCNVHIKTHFFSRTYLSTRDVKLRIPIHFDFETLLDVCRTKRFLGIRIILCTIIGHGIRFRTKWRICKNIFLTKFSLTSLNFVNNQRKIMILQ